MHTISRRRFLSALGAALPLPSPLVKAIPNGWLGDLFAADDPSTTEDLSSPLSRDPLRPQFHLLPAANWMNDPNGPVFYHGRYHMFYQYNPHGAYWGSMHWGHATSPDMVHWRHEPVALAPTPGGNDSDGVFSGATVLDRGKPTILYTGVMPPKNPSEATLKDGAHTWKEVQCMAIARDDDLRNWTKAAAPILGSPPPGLAVTGFRDPCLWREGNQWRMVVGSGFAGKGGAILLYASEDLHHWTYLHPLMQARVGGQESLNPVDGGEMWECPDFFPLGERHVLLISTKGKVFWKVGAYHDQLFYPEKEGTVDFGSYYAARTMLDRSGNRILWGWIPETRPEEEYRRAGWAGVMSLPRILTLAGDGSLQMRLAPEVEALRGPAAAFAGPELGGAELGDSKLGSAGHSPEALAGIAALRIHNLAAELQLSFTPRPGQQFQVELRSEQNELFASITYQPLAGGGDLSLNRRRAAMPSSPGVTLSLRLLLDGSVLELLANESVAITDRVYFSPTTPLKIVLPSDTPVSSLHLWPIHPISPDRLTG
jgi:beta-fructofuranosidase